MANESGEAAPPSAATEIGDDIMSAAANTLGVKLTFPKANETKKTDTAAAAAAGDEETPEDKTAREADEAAARENETPEETKTREAEETAAAEAVAKNETPEEKTAREADEAAAETPEGKAAKKLTDETKQFVEVKLKDLPEEVRKRVQGVIDSRVGKISVEAKAEQARLETRVEELSDELEEAKKGGAAPVDIPGLHPLFLVASEKDLEDRLTEIENFEAFADKYPDGYDGEAAKGFSPWTADQIKDRLRELRRERDRVIPAVRSNLLARAGKDVELKKSYPALFDRKSDEYRSAQALLKQMPELRRHADMNGLLAQLILGAKALTELSKPKTPAAAAGKTATTEPRKAPRVPGAGGPGRGSAITSPAAGKPATSDAMKTVMQKPGDRTALNRAVEALTADL